MMIKSTFFLLSVFFIVSCSGSRQMPVPTPPAPVQPAKIYPHGVFSYEAFRDTAHWKIWIDDTYQPAPEFIPLIAGEITGVEIRAYIGTWCGDSKEVVPQFFHLLDLVGYNKETIDYRLLNRDRQAWVTVAGADSISRVPTFIFLKNGVETGRITERPVTSLEADMVEILTK